MSDSSPAVRKRKWDDDENAGGLKVAKTEDGAPAIKVEDGLPGIGNGNNYGNGTPTSAADEAMLAAARIAAQVREIRLRFLSICKGANRDLVLRMRVVC